MAFTPRKTPPAPWITKAPKQWNRKKPAFNYQGRKWRNISKQFRINNPLCAQCQKEGRTTPSQVTDHIKPISQGGDAWDANNYQALCIECHNKKSRTEHHQK